MRILQRYLSMGLLIVAAVSLIAGCGNSNETMRQRLGMLGDPRLDAAVRRNIEATGGLDAWAGIKRIEGRAIATTFDTDGGRTLVEQRHTILPGNTDKPVCLTVVSNEPTGRLTERRDRKGLVRIKRTNNKRTIVEKDQNTLFGAQIKMFLEGQALTGCTSLLREGLIPRYEGLERQGGRVNHKVEVSGRLLNRNKSTGGLFEKATFWKNRSPEKTLDDIAVLWINTETSLIERIWLRYQKPHRPKEFGYMAVNVLDYEQVGKVKLPQRLEFVPTDEHQHFSRQNMMTVEFEYLTAIEKAK